TQQDRCRAGCPGNAQARVVARGCALRSFAAKTLSADGIPLRERFLAGAHQRLGVREPDRGRTGRQRHEILDVVQRLTPVGGAVARTAGRSSLDADWRAEAGAAGETETAAIHRRRTRPTMTTAKVAAIFKARRLAMLMAGRRDGA